MTYNVIEAVIAITAGLVAGSVALVGFGLDSVVEVSALLASSHTFVAGLQTSFIIAATLLLTTALASFFMPTRTTLIRARPDDRIGISPEVTQ